MGQGSGELLCKITAEGSKTGFIMCRSLEFNFGSTTALDLLTGVNLVQRGGEMHRYLGR